MYDIAASGPGHTARASVVVTWVRRASKDGMKDAFGEV